MFEFHRICQFNAARALPEPGTLLDCLRLVACRLRRDFRLQFVVSNSTGQYSMVFETSPEYALYRPPPDLAVTAKYQVPGVNVSSRLV